MPTCMAGKESVIYMGRANTTIHKARHHMTTTHTIKSRKTGNTYHYSLVGRSVYLDTTPDNRNHGTLGRQICYGGGFYGNTVSASEGKDFLDQVKKWHRRHIISLRADY